MYWHSDRNSGNEYLSRMNTCGRPSLTRSDDLLNAGLPELGLR
jgi:hypothetical protein